ncbi:carboxypeptidase-like regulatory domain-containing protein [Spirosoma pollinicola]|uniref:Carboxypeptidase-like regulatory domain-containing protein n=1 Tax=Spirosoma pollinicola TaxID=2057025 RepID=A0A2K8YWV7_9BACT|nr:carboxypeptidase-like regulatory domain-containing protein [Spirosoma pollinicola]AUD02074.1 hypothetical protein CWM47_09745 [Spirosoma pollinicola]
MLRTFLLYIYSLLLDLPRVASGKMITGSVMDEATKQPLVYAQIGVKNSPLGVITNEEGNFSTNLNRASSTDIVCISVIGYQAVTLLVSKFK